MKYILIFFSIVITSMFFFPFEFTFLQGINTKQMLVGLGILCLGHDIIVSRELTFSKELVYSSLIAIVFSLVSFYATDYNNTMDYAYSTYIGSMWVWYIACYGVCTSFRIAHGYISIRLIVDYLIVVCVLQCAFALLINFNHSFKGFIDSIFVTGDLAFMESVKRLYGIGALLDMAGVRFSIVLVMIAVLLSDNQKIRSSNTYTSFYIIAFMVISIIGNMIARTTSLGVILGLLYLLFKSGLWSANIKLINVNFWKILTLILLGSVGIVTYLYQTDKEVYTLLRFAFEGFFNWVETGTWETSSTEVLKDMWRFPSDLKTWIIGDGYFRDPFADMYYQQTDVGYLRFIYYCGLIGLLIFSFFFIYLSYALAQVFDYVKNLFLLLLIITFVNWIKVSTDIFLAYAFFLVISQPYFMKNYYRKDFELV